MGEERRRFPRIPESIKVEIHKAGDLTSWESVTSLDLSAGGVRFQARELLEEGSMLTLQIQWPGVSQPMTLEAQVAWSRLAGSGFAESGVEFRDVTPEQQVLIDQLVGFLRSHL